jgi:hypothetical protein
MAPVHGRFLHSAALPIMLVIVSLDIVELKYNIIIIVLLLYADTVHRECCPVLVPLYYGSTRIIILLL